MMNKPCNNCYRAKRIENCRKEFDLSELYVQLDHCRDCDKNKELIN